MASFNRANQMANNEQHYSQAAGPLQTATLIHTSPEGLTTGLVEIPTSDRGVPAYFAHPKDRLHVPFLLVLSEAFGLHEHIRDIVRRFAREGFFAVAPDLMIRQGDPDSFPDVPTLVRELLLKIPDQQVMNDLDCTLSWGLEQGADMNNAAITGFCWGGRWTWLFAAHRKLSAAVAWYGILDGRKSEVFRDVSSRYPTHPVDIVGGFQTPVLGLYGGKDEAIPLATIHEMQTALQNGSLDAQHSEIDIFADAGHAFFADYRASYRKDDAIRAWRQCVEWLQGHRNPAPIHP